MKLFSFFSFFFLFISFSTLSKENWILDKDLSTIKFELPLLLANNVKGEFKEIQGLLEIDSNSKKKNKGIFSVNINSIEMNYKKYRNLLLSDIFFNAQKFPIALVDTKKFSYQDQNKLNLNVELTIKGITNSFPLTIEIIKLAEELVQIKGKIKFSRSAYKIGTGHWKNTSILKDKVIIYINLFIFKE